MIFAVGTIPLGKDLSLPPTVGMWGMREGLSHRMTEAEEAEAEGEEGMTGDDMSPP